MQTSPFEMTSALSSELQTRFFTGNARLVCFASIANVAFSPSTVRRQPDSKGLEQTLFTHFEPFRYFDSQMTVLLQGRAADTDGNDRRELAPSKVITEVEISIHRC
mmetsp:Transcript_24813/g.36972  ORF Transcript_24813/g.36972 Transcript_24813/m.36972 type:complete len:106 (-) Transcript_24813:226-543(-)